MNYPYLIPGSQIDPTIFVANTSMNLGAFDKALDQIATLTVDYSKLPSGLIISAYSFKISPGGEPQLWISTPVLATNVLSFTIQGGIAGRAYEVVINARGVQGMVRSDVLTVNVLGEGCDCNIPPLPTYTDNAVSADGSIVVNLAPRFFVSNIVPINANVLDRWYNTTTGNVFDFITNGLVSYWVEAGMGGGGGGGGGNTGNIIKMQPIAPDGTTRNFTLVASTGETVAIVNTNTLWVSVDGVWQEPLVQYSAVDNQIVFIQPPFVDSVVFMLWFAPTS